MRKFSSIKSVLSRWSIQEYSKSKTSRRATHARQGPDSRRYNKLRSEARLGNCTRIWQTS